MALKYDETSIKILEGLEAVRKRPGMYIGSTDKRGLHHLVWEIVDNAIDEAINGFGDYIKVTIHKDKSVSVEDHGRGVPTGMHESGKSTPEVIYTVLHAGGKFESDGYKVSGGLHGVGSSVVNALSKWMEVTIKRDKKEYYIRFENGGHVAVPLKEIGTSNKTGTTVRFLPDDEIFTTTNFSYTTICERMQESAFLLKGITLEVIDEEDEREAKFHYERGIEEFVEELKKKKILFVAGGVGTAPVYPQVKWLHEHGVDCDVIMGSRNKDLLILEDEMKKVATNLYVTTDDGSYGFKGTGTAQLQELWDNGKRYDHCVAIGPMIMMKFVCKLTKELGIPTVVSMNPIMVDGTGMCGACRLVVGDEVKFACVDGPEFDGHLVDFDQAMRRQAQYKTEEGRAMLKLQEGATHHGGCGNCNS